MSNVVEIVNFKLAAGYTIHDFLKSNEKMDLFLKEQDGVLYRSLCESDDGGFVDIVYWDNIDNAKKAQQAFYSSELCQAFAQCIAKESVKLEHVNVLASFGCEQ